MNRISVPYIEGLGGMSDSRLLEALELRGAKIAVDQVCWPSVAPYKPLCAATLAHCGDAIAVLYHVRGLDLRGVNTADNGRQWEDSTCEFFVADPHDGSYYNFEINCLGFILGGKGEGRHNRLIRAASDISRIRRYSSLPPEAVEKEGGVYEWTIAMIIPFDLIGIAPGSVPVSLKANFYKCGDLTAHPHFLSWNLVGCPSPDFHRPEYFGELLIER